MNLKKLKLNYKRILKKLRIINPYIINLTKTKSVDYSKFLMITGTPRSGTTWLGELLSNIPKSIMLFEPLNLDENPKARQYGFNWRTYINSQAEDEKAKEFFINLLNGRDLNYWITREVPLIKLFSINYFIFKFVRANMLLCWLTNNFPIKKPVLIIRHPCAVISSQLRLKPFHKVKKPYFSDNDNLYRDFPNLYNNLNKYKNFEEILTARWCQENYVPLINNNYSFILVSYENLLIDPEKEINKIFNEWKIKIPKEIYKKISLSSTTTFRDIEHSNKYKVMSDWKTKLSFSQKKNILNVVKDFGMDFYTDNLEPDYDRLYGENPIRI